MRAFVVDESEEFRAGVEDVERPEPGDGEVLIAVQNSGVNFKDSMVAVPKSRVRRTARLIAGVDAAGVVLQSNVDGLSAGDVVAAHGGALGVSSDGGFAEYLVAPAATLTRLPSTLDARRAMIIGTAGFTSMMSVLALEHHGLRDGARVLVTGATGGVGSLAVRFLSARGYHPVASTGSTSEVAWLESIGAVEVIGRDEIADRPERVLASERWDGAVDCVGGSTLNEILRSLRYGSAVAASGLVASAELATTVYPFITRAVSLLGIDSVEAPSALRTSVWEAIGALAEGIDFEELLEREVDLEDLHGALDEVSRGATRGRILVRPSAAAQ